MEIQENVKTPIYKNDFVLCYVHVDMNFIVLYLQKIAVKTLTLPTIKKKMPILNNYFDAILKSP